MRMTPKTLTSKTRWSWATESFLGGARCAETGVVDQDVDPPGPLDHLPDRGVDRRVTGHVQVEEPHTVDRVTLAVFRLVPATSKAAFGQRAGGRPPDTRGRARHERHRPIRRHHELPTSLDYVRLTYVRNTIS